MNLAIIPARGGSKRIPRKNIKPFYGLPMLAWSIKAAQESGLFDKIIVSTDDPEIAAVATKFGADVPFIRPSELSDDHTGTSPVVRHAINTLASSGEGYDVVCCIYATSPFLMSQYLKKTFNLFTAERPSFVFSAASYAAPIQLALRIKADSRAEMISPQYAGTRSQDLEEGYHDAGQFYLGSSHSWLSKIGMFSGSAMPYVLPRHRVQDIDTEEDWVRAEYMKKVLMESGDT